MRSNALALRIPLNDEPVVEPVIDDIDSCDQVYSDPPVIEMIAEEFCFNSPDGTHTYIQGHNYCCHCSMAAPWVRRDACRS
jgi:hypothetical protein